MCRYGRGHGSTVLVIASKRGVYPWRPSSLPIRVISVSRFLSFSASRPTYKSMETVSKLRHQRAPHSRCRGVRAWNVHCLFATSTSVRANSSLSRPCSAASRSFSLLGIDCVQVLAHACFFLTQLTLGAQARS